MARAQWIREKISKTMKGRKPYQMTDEIRRKIGIGGRNSKKHKEAMQSEEYRRRMSQIQKARVLSGKHNFYKGGGSRQCQYKHICDIEWKLWRSKVFERDNWTCQTCGKRCGVNERVYLNAHHIKKWVEYPDLRYVVDNGVTLCRECHYILHRKVKV